MEKLHYSNVLIPATADWKHEIAGLLGGVDVGFRLVNKTRSGNYVIQISSPKKKNLTEVLDRAIDRF